MFLSKTKREEKLNRMQEDVPSVGTYFPLNDTIGENVRKKAEVGNGNPLSMLYQDKAPVPFASSEIRFKETRIEESKKFLGPGYYE